MKPFAVTQTKDLIAGQLRTQIFRGTLSDGEELVQETLAGQLGVSRMPVREALQMLEQEGLLVRLPNRHMKVVGINERIVRQAFRLISAITSETAELLIESQANLRELICISQQSQQTSSEFSNATISDLVLLFHSSFVQALDNSYLQRSQERGLDIFLYEIIKSSSSMPIETPYLIVRITDALVGGDRSDRSAAIRLFYDTIASHVIKEVFCGESSTP